MTSNLHVHGLKQILSRIALFPESCCPCKLCFLESLLEVLALPYSMFLVVAIDAISIHVLVKQLQTSALDRLRRIEYRENIQNEQKRPQNQTNS